MPISEASATKEAFCGSIVLGSCVMEVTISLPVSHGPARGAGVPTHPAASRQARRANHGRIH